MAGRFPRPLIPFGEEWNQRTRARLYEYLQSLYKGMSGLQSTPGTPVQIQAGVAASIGTGQAVALANHVHSISTAAPTVPVAFGGAADEGSASSMLRSDAKLILAAGSVDEQTLVWDGTAWVPTHLEDYDILNWINL